MVTYIPKMSNTILECLPSPEIRLFFVSKDKTLILPIKRSLNFENKFHNKCKYVS